MTVQNKERPMSQKEKWEYQECFKWFDKDCDGYISTMELSVALRAAGQYWSFEELKQLASSFGSKSKVSLEQFLSLCAKKHGQSPDLKALEKSFEVFDREKNGKVYLEDLRHILSSVGEKITTEEFNELCAIVGIPYMGGNQTITKDQFMLLFGNVPENTETL